MAKVEIAPSHRMDSIKEYYFSKKNREIAELRKAGRDIISLGIGSPDMPPAQAVIDRLAKEAQRPDVHAYQPYNGSELLRKAYADWYEKWYNVTLDPKSEVLPLLGSKEGIMHICMAFLDEGDKVLVPNPGYPTYRAAVTLSGGEVLEYRLNAANGFYPDFEEIEKEDLSKVKLMFVNYPNMPTGTHPTVELFEKLVAFAGKHNILLVEQHNKHVGDSLIGALLCCLNIEVGLVVLFTYTARLLVLLAFNVPLHQLSDAQVILKIFEEFLQTCFCHIQQFEFCLCRRRRSRNALSNILLARARGLHHLVYRAVALRQIAMRKVVRHIIHAHRFLEAQQFLVIPLLEQKLRFTHKPKFM